MTKLRFKPVVSAGFSILLAAGSAAQDFIDVEAERQASRQATSQPTPLVVDPTPTASSATGASAPASNGYSVPGIRPYSGQTTTATPVDASPAVTSQPRATGTTADASNVGALVVQVQQLAEEVRRLNGVVEEQTAQLQRLKEQSLERYVDIDRRLADIGRGAGGSVPAVGSGADFGAGSASGSGVSPATGGADTTPAQPGEEAAYQAAYDYVKSRNFPRAVEAFKSFLGDFPFGRFAPNAHYWLGELYLVLDPPDPELARQSFKLLLDQYPSNPKVPDALYKLGKVHFLKGNRERAQGYLDQVIKSHPGHPAAQLAQDFFARQFLSLPMSEGQALQLRITEIFHSLQGEARTVGLPTVFVRLTGCPLRCVYCDTEYAFSGGQLMTLDAILEQIEALGCRRICVTGGEPLAQPECLPLLERLCDEGYSVSLETSGAMPLERVDTRVSRVMDLKTPDSGESHRNRYDNIALLTPNDQVKFVVAGRNDYEWARFKIDEYQLLRRVSDVLFSPSHHVLSPTELAEWMLADKLDARLQVQMHKLLWNDEPGH